jgi:hypothetical protein
VRNAEQFSSDMSSPARFGASFVTALIKPTMPIADTSFYGSIDTPFVAADIGTMLSTQTFFLDLIGTPFVAAAFAGALCPPMRTTQNACPNSRCTPFLFADIKSTMLTTEPPSSNLQCTPLMSADVKSTMPNTDTS